MALKNQSIVLTYIAWDTANNVPKTGDVANHTLRVITDGVSAAPSNSPSEVDSTNAPGVYKITLTAGEMNGNTVTFAGKSSTSGVSIVPVQITTERGNLDAAVSTRGTYSGGAITGNITGNLSGSVGSVTGNVGGNVNGNVVGSVGSLATQAKADVNAEADTAISDALIVARLTEIQASLQNALVELDSGGLTGTIKIYTPGTAQSAGNLLRTIPITRDATTDPFSFARVS